MTKTETVKRPEYEAWLIRHAGRVLLIAVLSLVIFMYIPILVLLVFHIPISAIVAILLLNIAAPVIYSTLAIIVMRWYGAREGVIKTTAMVLFFLFMMGGVYSAWDVRTRIIYLNLMKPLFEILLF